eukprot:scaffold2929_cov107-Cylindrotheca_fusiformis.AAC.7
MNLRSSALALLLPLTCSGEDYWETASNSNSNGGDGFYSNGGGSMGMDLNQGDDLLSVFSDYGGDMVSMMFGQCLEGFDLDAAMDNPFGAVNNRCTTTETATFNAALDGFQTCSGFDLRELIETFGSVYLGLVLNCGSYVMDVADTFGDLTMLDIDRLKEQETPLPRVNAQCVDALVGDNPFGKTLLYMDEFPEREMKCFMELSKKLPTCTLSEWPVPIVGSWLKVISCIYGSLEDVIQPVIQEQLQGQLQGLSACLPANSDDITESSCKDIRTSCIFDLETPVLTMAMPPPFWAGPIGDECMNMVKDSDQSVIDRYETFRNVCVPAEDRAVWDIATSQSSRDAATGGGASGFIDAAAAEKGNVSKATGGSSSSSKFVPGLFVGMIVAFVAMFGLQKWKGNNGAGGDPSKMGYAFNSLELTESPREFA